LLHGDLWPGNVLWQDGRLVAVVDWEDGAAGARLIDVAIARSDLSWGYGWDAMEAFTARYATRTGCDLSALPLWNLRATLRQAPNSYNPGLGPSTQIESRKSWIMCDPAFARESDLSHRGRTASRLGSVSQAMHIQGDLLYERGRSFFGS
tara:strand:+ start:154 stop:603 length:450 start_codon:yes stop_codon:yes gene_type:complete